MAPPLTRLRRVALLAVAATAVAVPVSTGTATAAPTPASAARATPSATTGYWHTSGSEILDSAGDQVRIAGINWYGFETTDEVPHGLWSSDYKAIIDDIRALGYNTIRLPWSDQMVEDDPVPSAISFANSTGPINTDLKGLHSLDVMDRIISYAGQDGLKVILDNHRSEAGNSAEQNGLWYTSQYPESAWLNDWTALAKRYAGDSTVIGVDLRNEPHTPAGQPYGTGATWGTGSPATDWRLAAERAGNAVLAVDPNLLVAVEGIDVYQPAGGAADSDWWGGNLEGAAAFPVQLSVPGRLVYSAHDYGPDLFAQTWFNSATSYASLSAVWDKFWGYLNRTGTAPVWVGEFGTTNSAADISSTAAGSQGQWFSDLVQYIKAGNLNWTYWALNGEDEFGLLDNQYDLAPASAQKEALLAGIQSAAPGGGGGDTTAPSAPTGLAVTGTTGTTVALTWSPSTDNVGVTGYTVYRDGTAVGTATGTGYTDTGLAAATSYRYTVAAADAAGNTSAPSAAVTATTGAGGGDPGCSAAYQLTQQWSGGFTATVTVTDTGPAAITGWTVGWPVPPGQQITGVWNAVGTTTGSAETAVNETYNGALTPGTSTTFGVQGTTTATPAIPTPTCTPTH